MMQVELGTDIEKHLLRTAAAQGISVAEILRKALSGSRLRPDTRQNDEEAAVDLLASFARKHRFTLGPDLSPRDLIYEGRR